MICLTIRVLILWTSLIAHSFWIERVPASMTTNYFERNSSYAERQWNITLGRWNIENRHMEDCLLKFAPKHSTWFSKGPLCQICARVISKKFPSNESIKLRYAAFIHGFLTWPGSQDELFIDVILCNYDLDVGLDRFYLTRGVEEHSAHFLKAIGSRNHTYTFILDDYVTYDESNSTQDSLQIKSGGS